MSGFKRFMVVVVLFGTATGLQADDKPVAQNRTVELTFEEMTKSAADAQAEMASTFREMMAMKERVQKQKDVIKLNCVNDKLIQVKAQLNIGDQQAVALRGSIENRSDAANAQYRELRATGDNVRKLREEATACLGESELFKQESGVEVDRPEITDDPTTIDPYEVDPTLEVEPPGYASAFS